MSGRRLRSKRWAAYARLSDAEKKAIPSAQRPKSHYRTAAERRVVVMCAEHRREQCAECETG
jgi:hypothetical protein